MNTTFLHYHPDVAAALKAGRPVVALESTLITHGLPYPVNQEVARAMEQTVREAGATPATIAGLRLEQQVAAALDRVPEVGGQVRPR